MATMIPGLFRTARRACRAAGALLTVCTISGCSAATRAADSGSIAGDERAVLSAVIQSHLREGAAVLMVDSTINADALRDLPGTAFLRRLEIRFPHAAIQDLRRANVQAASMPALVGEMPGLEWVTDDDLESLLRAGGWKGVWERFPGARSVIRLSRVGFDGPRRHAAVFLDFTCGNLCGGTQIVLLRHDRQGGWTIAERVPLSIS